MNEQRLIIAGSRGITNKLIIAKAMTKFGKNYGKYEVLSGLAKGVDSIARQLAIDSDIQVWDYTAEWEKEGKSAGYKRNKRMADDADALLAIWDGKSKGTKHMIDIAIKQRLSPIIIHIVVEET